MAGAKNCGGGRWGGADGLGSRSRWPPPTRASTPSRGRPQAPQLASVALLLRRTAAAGPLRNAAVWCGRIEPFRGPPRTSAVAVALASRAAYVVSPFAGAVPAVGWGWMRGRGVSDEQGRVRGAGVRGPASTSPWDERVTAYQIGALPGAGCRARQPAGPTAKIKGWVGMDG